MNTVPISPLDLQTPGGPKPPLKLLRFAAVRSRTGLSRSTIWRLERRGAFPRHRRISANAVAWVDEEITDWIRSKVGPIEPIAPVAPDEGSIPSRRLTSTRSGGAHVPSRQGSRSTRDPR
jgi:prophage regulatory protein